MFAQRPIGKKQPLCHCRLRHHEGKLCHKLPILPIIVQADNDDNDVIPPWNCRFRTTIRRSTAG
jgi:hypothetical protein